MKESDVLRASIKGITMERETPNDRCCITFGNSKKYTSTSLEMMGKTFHNIRSLVLTHLKNQLKKAEMELMSI